MKCVGVYKELYHQEPFDVAFCPYRISPLGAHIDHQYGKINGLAIDKGIHMAYHPKQNGVVELQSLNFPKRAQFFVSAVPEEKQGDWADEKLYPHLLEIDRAARERMDAMLPRMMEATGVTEELKARDPMRWVGLMNTLKAQVEEVILTELIYQ